MPFASVYRCRICPFPTAGILGLTLLFLLSLPQSALAVFLSPLQGSGNFPASFEVINRWQDDGTLDVLILVEVRNADLSFRQEDRGMVSRLRLEVQLDPLDGDPITAKRPFRTPSLVKAETNNQLLHQVFGLVLRDVPYREGRLSLQLYDVIEYRTGLYNQMKRKNRRSECSADWYAEDGPRPAAGVALGDPLYLFLAPLAQWDPSSPNFNEAEGGLLHDYMHPSRRYGIEQERLQVFLPIWPPEGGVVDEMPQGVAVRASHLEMDFAVQDTLFFDAKGKLALEAGRPAGLFYELDVNLLPQGSYRLSAAPLGGQGRAQMTGFDVVWSLGSLARHSTRLSAEGHLVFEGRDLDSFLQATRAGREAMLDEFWDERNPDPESPVNEAYLEFQARMSYVSLFLGGFYEKGCNDPRGHVLICLGPPDEIQRESMPQNYREQDDAQIKVFQRHAPDREGHTAKGSSYSDTQGLSSPYDRVGGIPMPYSERAVDRISNRQRTASHSFGFELWKYTGNGRPLYTNIYSRSSMGSRFLFVDRTGSGDFYLESSNTLQGEE